MSEIQELMTIDFGYVFLSVLIMFVSLKCIVTLFDWGMNRLGIETKAMRHRREEHDLIIKTSEELNALKGKHEESVEESNRQDGIIRQDISNLANTVNGIVNTLADMQKRENDSKLKELKDDLIRYYNKYKDIGEWSKLESDAFWGLFSDYEDRGGDGYIHSVVEPVMRDLREIE